MLLEHCNIRSFTKDDYPACVKIYEDGMATGIATFETTAPNWEQWNAKFLIDFRLVAEVSGKIKGWIAVSPFSKREVYRGVAEVSLYIDQKAQRQGIGRLLLQECIKQSEKGGIWTLQAKIFPQNTTSLHLFEKCGFRIVGVREKMGNRDGVWYDNVLMERRSKLKKNTYI